MAMPRHVGGEHSDLAIGDLARRASVLARDAARGLALFQKAGLIDDQNRVLITKRFQRVLTDNVAQRVGVPLPPAQDRLLAPGAWIAGRFRSHPTRLAWLVAQQSVEKLPHRGCNALLRKQPTDALLDLSQRRSPQRQRIFNRRATNHQIPNHGRPWIQNFQYNATVMLDLQIDFSGGVLTRFGPPTLLSPDQALASFVEHDIASRSLLPINLTLLAERLVATVSQAPVIRTGPRATKKERNAPSSSRPEAVP